MKDDLRYPIGRYKAPENIDMDQINTWIESIDAFPEQLIEVMNELSESDLEKLHREGGWTIRQLVHHVADSHLNSFLRFKLALTEDNPTIKPYDEVKFSHLNDSENGPVNMSIGLIKSLHKRWVYLMKNMSKEDWERTFYHSEMGKSISLKWTLGLYAWHGDHHLAHIGQAMELN